MSERERDELALGVLRRALLSARGMEVCAAEWDAAFRWVVTRLTTEGTESTEKKEDARNIPLNPPSKGDFDFADGGDTDH